jgi:hypothetical protein
MPEISNCPDFIFAIYPGIQSTQLPPIMHPEYASVSPGIPTLSPAYAAHIPQLYPYARYPSTIPLYPHIGNMAQHMTRMPTIMPLICPHDHSKHLHPQTTTPGPVYPHPHKTQPAPPTHKTQLPNTKPQPSLAQTSSSRSGISEAP